MNTQDEHQETAAYNPFPEPQTIPSGWDTSGLYAAPAPVSAVETGESTNS